MPGAVKSNYLDDESSQNHTAEDGIAVDALKHIPLAVDLASVDLVEELHHDEDVEDDGVVFRGRGVQGHIATVVDVKNFLSYSVGRGRKLIGQNIEV